MNQKSKKNIGNALYLYVDQRKEKKNDDETFKLKEENREIFN
jgi:hypothetical protein